MEILGRCIKRKGLVHLSTPLCSKQCFEGKEAAAGKADVMFLPSGIFRETITWPLQPASAKTTCISPTDCGGKRSQCCRHTYPVPGLILSPCQFQLVGIGSPPNLVSSAKRN